MMVQTTARIIARSLRTVGLEENRESMSMVADMPAGAEPSRSVNNPAI